MIALIVMYILLFALFIAIAVLSNGIFIIYNKCFRLKKSEANFFHGNNSLIHNRHTSIKTALNSASEISFDNSTVAFLFSRLTSTEVTPSMAFKAFST